MKTLYLDTSSNYLFTGISNNRKVIEERKLKLDKGLSSFALPEIEKMLLKCNLDPNDIDKIIVVNGPGSFTGIRIGVTIAKIYAWSLKKNITTISSLEAMKTSASNEYDYIVPMIDARRNYVFGGIYDRDGNTILPGQYVKKDVLESAMESLNGKIAVITNDNIDTNYDKIVYNPNIEKIIESYEDKQPINPHAVEPNYLKLTEAEEKKND